MTETVDSRSGISDAAVVSHGYEDPYLICRFYFPGASKGQARIIKEKLLEVLQKTLKKDEKP